MKDKIIAEESAAYKNNEVKRNFIYSKVDRAIEASDEAFDHQIYALEKKISEADYNLDKFQKNTPEYEQEKGKYLSLKAEIDAQIKELVAQKKDAHKIQVEKGKEEKRKADEVYKKNRPALKKALDEKIKIADAEIKKFKEEEKAKYLASKSELDQKLLSAKEAQNQDEIKHIQEELKELKREYKSKFTITKQEAKEAALNVMREVGIPQPEVRFKQYPFEFSGGMRQRIVIAIALTANPDVLICDEPTTALDVTIQAQILELINKLKRERNMSIIFITHDLGVVANMADRVAVMYAGKIVEVGNVNEIFYDPRHPYTWALLSSIPDIDSKEKLEAIPGTPPYLLNPPKGDAFALRNKYAMSIDFEKQPPFFKVSETHYAATWLLDQRAPKIEKPKIVSERIKVSLEKAGVIDHE
ncbi:MAG: ATP-binding cassette domain-containing protein [Bacilli bacterium]|nr:ATP-binding cassette domain-containing protein [Bacilli bacterium]